MTGSSKAFDSYKSRCFASVFILDYFSRRGIDPDSLLRGTGIAKDFIDNPHNWITVTKLQSIMQNCYCAIPSLTLYDWQEIASQLQHSNVADFFKGVTSLLGSQNMYKIAPRYIKRSCNYQYLELIKLEEGIADFISYLEPDVVRIASGYTFQLTAGTLAAVRTSEGLSPADATILFDQSSLKNIVKKMYRHHGLSYRKKGDRIVINGKIIGRMISLEKEVINGKSVYSVIHSFKPPHNAILLTDDLVHNDSILLRQGDIFDAPYSRICINWDMNSDKSEKKKDLFRDTDLAKQTFLLLEEQIKLAEERFFESEKLREKEKKISRKLKLANRKLKKEIAERKKAEMLLKKREKEMEIQTANMQEANTALRVLLKKRDEDKKNFSEKVLFNIKELILPYLEKLKETDLKAPQRAYVEILESNFGELSNPLALKLSLKYFNLTPAEIRVAILIRQGHTTHDIAEQLQRSPRTIDAYRANIRRKLKIRNKKINLCTYLNSI